MARGAMPKKKNIVLYGFAIAVVTLIGITSAAAQLSGLFEALFGGMFRAPPAATHVEPLPPRSAAPRISITITPRHGAAVGGTIGSNGTVGYCVRLCDGRYFPLPRLGSSRATSRKSCHALCPATRTKIYWGSQIDRAVAAGAGPYSRLDTAFKFRRELVGGCTCNGRDALGTADINILADLTLRRGDIVVTENGLRVFVGPRADKHRPTAFTPIENYAGLSQHMRRRLDSILVAAAPQPAPEVVTFGESVMFGIESLESQIVPLNAAPIVH